MEVNAIVFDLDGTLVDTVPDVRLALNAMLRSYGLQDIGREEVYSLIGNGARAMIEKAFAINGASPSSDDISMAITLYIQHYKANPVVETKIYNGVTEILEYYHDHQVRLAICTNKPAVMTEIVLQKLDLLRFFSVILAGDEVARPKPHADHLHTVISRMGLDYPQAVMVGDSEVDMACASNAGIPFVGVSYGYHLGNLQTEHLIHRISDLPNALRKFVYA